MTSKLEKAFKTGYEAGYIDDEGYLLNNIPISEFNELRKSGMIKKVGNEFKLCPMRKSTFNVTGKNIGYEYGSDEDYDFGEKWGTEHESRLFEVFYDEFVKQFKANISEINVGGDIEAERIIKDIVFDEENLRAALDYEIGEHINVNVEVHSDNKAEMMADVNILGITVRIRKEFTI